MAIEYAMLCTTTKKTRKEKDKTGMYTYTCNKTDDDNNEERERKLKKKPVRRISLSGTWLKIRTNGVLDNQG